MDYLTVEEIRDEFGAEVAELTDRAIVRKLDRLGGLLEDALGHAFGRSITVVSSAGDTVQVTALALVIGGDSYAFADYATLGTLVNAVNAAADTYTATLLPRVDAQTPSTLLRARAATACGPTYDKRVVLDISALYLRMSGERSPYLFLPLALVTVTAVVENGTALEVTAYWAVPGEPWLIRKQCACETSTCRHPQGHWSAMYPGNITVTYVPQWWGSVPGVIKQALLSAFASDAGLSPMESESFGEYSYRRGAARVDQAHDILGGAMIRPYAVRFHP